MKLLNHFKQVINSKADVLGAISFAGNRGTWASLLALLGDYMAYQFDVYCRRCYSEEEFQEFVCSCPGLNFEKIDRPPLACGDQYLNVVQGASQRYAFTVYLPRELGAADIPEWVEAVLPAPRYIWRIVIERKGAVPPSYASRFVQEMICELDGVAVDTKYGRVWLQDGSGVLAKTCSVEQGMADLLDIGLDDWVSLDDVARCGTGGHQTLEAKDRTLRVLGRLFGEGLMVPGDLKAQGFVDWPSPEKWLEKAERELNHFDWHPMGAGFWLRLTELGEERARAELAGG